MGNSSYKIGATYQIELNGVGIFIGRCFKIDTPYIYFCSEKHLLEINLKTQAFKLTVNNHGKRN